MFRGGTVWEPPERHMSDAPQMRTMRFILRLCLFHLLPECRRVIEFGNMTELVDDDVVHERLGQEDNLIVKV